MRWRTVRSVLFIADTYNSVGRVFLDANELSNDGTVAVAGTTFTKDGTIMAVAVSDAGSDYHNVVVRPGMRVCARAVCSSSCVCPAVNL
jgi:hypothetical protein